VSLFFDLIVSRINL